MTKSNVVVPLDTKRPSLIAESIQLTLRSKLEGPITPSVLLQIEQLARLGRETLAVEKDPTALGKRKKCGYIGGYGDITSGEAGEEMVLANPVSSAETYGARLLREFIPALQQLVGSSMKASSPSYTELVFAIAHAKKMRLSSHVIKKLEDQLMSLDAVKSLPALPMAPKKVEQKR